MKMSEFLALSDAEKEAEYEKYEDEDGCHSEKITEDSGICSQCGGKVDAGDFHFGCHKLVCPDCVFKEPHF